MKIPRIFITLYLLGFCFSVSAVNYYFSSYRGNDSNSGTSSSSPWQSITKLNALIRNLRPGDVVYLEKGSSWNSVHIDISNLAGTPSSPIVFSTYGTGAKPRFKGSKVTGSFVQNGNIWKCIDQSFPDYISETRKIIPFLYIDGKAFETSRYPNSGYLATSTQNTKNYLEDYSQNWSVNGWVNALLSVRAVSYEWATQKITGNSNNSLVFESLSKNLSYTTTPYLIRNHLNACDLNGEWAQQNDTVWVFYSNNLNASVVEVPVIDTVIAIRNCTNLIFKSIQIERANMMNLFSDNSSVSFQSCSFFDAGYVLLEAINASSLKTDNCIFSRGRRNGVVLTDGQGTITNSVFRNFAFEGADNGNGFYGSTILSNRAKGITTIEYNDFDSVNVAFNCHYSDAEINFRYNFVRNYGMTIEDLGATYVGGDFTNFNKYIKRNIYLDAHNKFNHAVYLDYLTSNTYIDSNSIANSNIAVYMHVCDDNYARYNNIVNPAKDMKFPWNSAFRLDEYSYHIASEGSLVSRNVFEYNNVAFSSNENELAAAFFRLTSVNSNTFRYNKYFDPFTSDDDIIVKGENYDLSSYSTFNLSSWNSATGLETGSSRNPTNWIYQSSLGITQQEFILFLYNPSKKDSVFDLARYGADYYDVNGNTHSGSIAIKPYYSEILFYKEKSTSSSNRTPVISQQTFVVEENEAGEEVIGTVAASDPDAGQTLKYSITGGNAENTFSIDPATGRLYLTNSQYDFVADVTYFLVVEVIDNGAPARKNSAQITVQVKAVNHAPVLNDQVFNLSYEKPPVRYIGQINAYDPDPGQLLYYTISSDDQTFIINNASGEIYLNNNDFTLYDDEIFTLTVDVSDNGNPVQHKTAQVTIKYIYADNFVYIDPENINDPLENGTYTHPFDSWNDVTWEMNYAYLQKSNTVCEIEMLNILANNISIGSYGNGNKPVIRSKTKDFLIRAYNGQDIAITNLVIEAPEAVSCMYFFGSDSYNITVENCEFANTLNAIKITGGYNFNVSYNKFENLDNGLVIYSKNNKIYYNLFIDNASAINLNGDYSVDQIINNVFYENKEGVICHVNSTLSLYNNIFYFGTFEGLAFSVRQNDFSSNHNLFYPDRAGLVIISEKTFNSFGEYQNAGTNDRNSFIDDPLFVDVEKYDFSVSITSPVIDAGILYQQEYDYIGTPVPIGDLPDIGAVESKASVSVNEADDPENYLIVYPNPSNGNFTLKISANELYKKGIIRITSLTGKTIFFYSFNSGEDEFLFDNTAPVLERGYYLITMELDSKISFVGKLVIL